MSTRRLRHKQSPVSYKEKTLSPLPKIKKKKTKEYKLKYPFATIFDMQRRQGMKVSFEYKYQFFPLKIRKFFVDWEGILMTMDIWTIDGIGKSVSIGKDDVCIEYWIGAVV